MPSPQSLTLPGRFEHVQQLCQFVSQGAAAMGMDEGAVFHVELACDEACTNIIEHAYGAEDAGDIEVTWETRGTQFVITICDTGHPFDPSQVASPPERDGAVGDSAPEVQVGGLGVHFMRKLMDDVRFSFADGVNRVIMVKEMSS